MVRSASSKSNMGHLEACAAAAGLAALVLAPLGMTSVVDNTQLRRQVLLGGSWCDLSNPIHTTG